MRNVYDEYVMKCGKVVKNKRTSLVMSIHSIDDKYDTLVVKALWSLYWEYYQQSPGEPPDDFCIEEIEKWRSLQLVAWAEACLTAIKRLIKANRELSKKVKKLSQLSLF